MQVVALSSRRLRLVCRILLALYAVWGVYYIFRTSFSVEGTRTFVLWDDGMVSMRYARNLATGHGLVWNVDGDRVQGYSDLAITLFMAAIHLLSIDTTKTALIFQLFNLGLLVGCALLVRDISKRLFESDLSATVATALFMVCAPVAILTLQGTDVGVVSFVVLGALRMVVAATADGGPWPTHVFAFLAVGILARLDFALIYTVFMMAALAFPRTKSAMLIALIILTLTVGGILIFQYVYYGDLLPNTYYLKLTGSPTRLVLAEGLRQQLGFFERAGVVVGAASLTLAILKWTDRRIGLLGALPCALIAYDIACGGDWLEQYTSRFFAPALSLLIIATVGAYWLIAQNVTFIFPGSKDRPPVPGSQTTLRVTGFVVFSILSIPAFNTHIALREWCNPFAETMNRSDNIENVRLAKYLRAHASKDATVAVVWAGALPYFLDRYTIDAFGKSDRYIARKRVPIFLPGHSKWDWRYVIDERRPDFVASACTPTCRGDLDDRTDFKKLYYLAQADGLMFFVRKESVAKLGGSEVEVGPVM